MIQIKRITAPETYEIRLEELRNNIPLPVEFKGDFDEDTIHLGAFKGDTLIAVSSFMKTKSSNFSGEQYQLRGMATLNKFQGFGAGKLMLKEVFSIFNALKVDYLWCNARIIAVEFYKKQGFKTSGELFNLKYIGDHYIMYKNLNE